MALTTQKGEKREEKTMGRAPCCDKANVKKGPWSPEEDAKLKAFIEQQGTGGNWIALPQKIGLKRCGKSCRLRWLNYLRPNIKHGGFSEEEDSIICSLYTSIGSRWSIIAAQLPGRTDNDIKNYWNTRLKKKLLGKQRKEQQTRRACCLNQELKNVHGNFVATDTTNQNPYWPDPLRTVGMTVPVPYQDPRLNDQASIRKLLIKLGGRVYDSDQQPSVDGMTIQYPLDTSTAQRLYENSIDMFSSSASINSFTDTCSSSLSNQYSSNGAGQSPLLQSPSSFPMERSDMIYNDPQRLEGLLYCYYHDQVGMMNEGNGANSAESTSWGDIGNSVYPSPLPNCKSYHQEMFQECILNDAKYMASQ